MRGNKTRKDVWLCSLHGQCCPVACVMSGRAKAQGPLGGGMMCTQGCRHSHPYCRTREVIKATHLATFRPLLNSVTLLLCASHCPCFILQLPLSASLSLSSVTPANCVSHSLFCLSLHLNLSYCSFLCLSLSHHLPFPTLLTMSLSPNYSPLSVSLCLSLSLSLSLASFFPFTVCLSNTLLVGEKSLEVTEKIWLKGTTP